jgi:hypothetical protein
VSWSGVPELIRERHILGEAIETWQRWFGCGERAFEEAIEQRLERAEFDRNTFDRIPLAVGFDRDRLLPEFTD